MIRYSTSLNAHRLNPGWIVALAFGLTGCGATQASDNTKFQAACLKSLPDWRCDCAQRALRTTMSDDDFHKIAEWIEPGKIDADNPRILASGVNEIVGERYARNRNIILNACIGPAAPFGGEHPGRYINSAYDDMGRMVQDGPNKGKRDYEVQQEQGR